MARNLLRGKHRVRGFDLQAEALKRHVEAGGQGAASAAEAARGAEFVITMLPTAEHVRSALLGGGGALEGLAAGTLVIDMSTIHPLASDGIRAALEAQGVAMLDAPVGRTSAHAREGKLLIMAGGGAEDIVRARPLLALLGDTIVDCGGAGRGIRMKIVNNFLSIALAALTGEALCLAEAAGLEQEVVTRVLMGTAAGQGHLATTFPNKVLAGDLRPDFRLDLAHKDLGLALDFAAAEQVPVALGAAARQLYSAARAQGRGDQDWTAVYLALRELTGLLSPADS